MDTEFEDDGWGRHRAGDEEVSALAVYISHVPFQNDY